MIDKSIPAHNTDSPVEKEKWTSKNLTKTERPMKPYTTEGIPESIFTKAFNTLLILSGSKIEIKMANPTPIGIAIHTAIIETNKVAAKKSFMETWGLALKGCHSLPKIKLDKETLLNNPTLSFRINTRIKVRRDTEVKANNFTKIEKIFSILLRIKITFSKY